VVVRNECAAGRLDIRSTNPRRSLCAVHHALRAHARAATGVVSAAFPLSSPADDARITAVRSLNRFAGSAHLSPRLAPPIRTADAQTGTLAPWCAVGLTRPPRPLPVNGSMVVVRRRPPVVSLIREGGCMRRRQSKSAPRADWPWTLRWIIQAAEHECPQGHANALRELSALALNKVPSRGIFDPGVRGEEDLFAAIESVAKAHLELAEARVAWRNALEAGGLNLDQRDGLEQAALQVQSVSDTAYFYTGLAFGIAFLHAHRAA
jgi:hypothetical protein